MPGRRFGDGLFGEGFFGETMTDPVTLTLPPPGVYTDIERDWIENEPPGLLPTDQDSLWGQQRRIYAGYLQVLADLLAQWYLNLDPGTVGVEDIGAWEYMVGVPPGGPSEMSLRRAAVKTRARKGAFTHTGRRNIIERHILAAIPLLNGDFEIPGRPNWFYVENGMSATFFDDVDTWSKDGSRSLLFRATNAADTSPRKAGVIYSPGYPGVPVAPGSISTVTAWVKTVSTANPELGYELELRWYDSGGGLLSVNAVTATPTSVGQEHELAITATAPASAAFMGVRITLMTDVPSDVIEFYTDKIEMTRDYTPSGWLPNFYLVRESTPKNRNLLANGGFETNITGWSGVSNTLVRVTDNAKYGTAAMRSTGTVAGFQFSIASIALTGATAGRVYTGSIWVRGFGAAIGKTFEMRLQESGGAFGDEFGASDTVVLTAEWQRLVNTRTIARNDRTLAVLVAFLDGGAVDDVYWVDGAQIELGDEAHDFVDPEQSPYYYEVRINQSNVNFAAMGRDLEWYTPAPITFNLYSTIHL